MVYFISSGTEIKIGFTKGNPKNRLKQLSTGSSSPLYLLGYILNGDKKLENELHSKFKRVNLEWFDGNDNNLIDYINENNDMNVYIDFLNDKLQVFKKMKK